MKEFTVEQSKVEVLNGDTISIQNYGKMQRVTDEYIELYKKQKKLKEEMDALRNIIEPYMLENNIEELKGFTVDGYLKLSEQERPTVTARYSTYDIEEISPLLPTKMKNKCIVKVIDKEALEGLYKLGEISEEILHKKNTKKSVRLSVKDK